jgi:hypothetical protein
MPGSVRLRVIVELLDDRGQHVIQAESQTFVQGSRLAELQTQIARGQFQPLDTDSNTVAQTAFNLCRDSYKRVATALMTRGEAA